MDLPQAIEAVAILAAKKKNLEHELNRIETDLIIVNQQLKKLRRKRDALRVAARPAHHYTTGERRSGAQDAEIVCCVDLKPYIERHLLENSKESLGQRANVATKTISRILSGEGWTTLTTADRILSAIGRSVNDVAIHRNPRYKAVPHEPPPTHYYEE